MLYREVIAVCSEIHTKHINTLCGQNVLVEFLIPFPKLRKAAIGFFVAVCPSVVRMKRLGSQLKHFYDIWIFFENLSRNSNFH